MSDCQPSAVRFIFLTNESNIKMMIIFTLTSQFFAFNEENLQLHVITNQEVLSQVSILFISQCVHLEVPNFSDFEFQHNQLLQFYESLCINKTLELTGN